MRRFFIEPSEIEEGVARITGTDANHIKNVLRLKAGTPIELMDGKGTGYKAEITLVTASETRAAITGPLDSATESPAHITVAQAFLKDKKMDLLVRHLTELGIAGWFPFRARRSVSVPDKKKLAARQERWSKIAREALKQCERSVLPEIGTALSFEEMLARKNAFDLKIIFLEREAKNIDSVKTKHCRAKNILVVFGPEGGFAPEETKQLQSHGFIPLSLGPRILRAETATIAGVALIQHLFGDMN